jgi:hypothetical protein
MKKLITAKFSSRCAETGNQIKKGEKMFFDTDTKKCYSVGVDQNAVGMVQANENAYFDNFCYMNNL